MQMDTSLEVLPAQVTGASGAGGENQLPSLVRLAAPGCRCAGSWVQRPASWLWAQLWGRPQVSWPPWPLSGAMSMAATSPGAVTFLSSKGGILAAPASVPLVLLGAVCVAMLGPALGAAEHLTVTSLPPG